MKLIQLVITLILLSVVMSVQAKMPKHTYACHVQTVDNELGIAFMQADQKPKAELEAIGRDAYVARDRTQKTASVVECVRVPGNSLSNPIAQQLLESIPR